MVWQTTTVTPPEMPMTLASPHLRQRDAPRHRASGDGDTRSHRGSLRSKLVLSLAAIFLVFLTIDEMVRQQVIQPEFVALERAGGIRDANRVLAAMNAEVEHLRDFAAHWASQMSDRSLNPAAGVFFPSNPKTTAWSTQKLDWAALIGPQDSWKWLHRSNPPSPGTPSNCIDDHFRSLVQACSKSSNRITSGMTRIGDQSLVMFAVVGLDMLDDPDPKQGRYLVACRKIDEPLVTVLRRQTQVEFSLQSPRTSEASQKLVVWEADRSTLVVEVQLTGVNDQKLANVYIRVPRDITARSRRTTSLARNSFIFGSVAALLMLLLMLQRIVISPLTAIRQHSDRVGQEGLATDPLVLTRNDEIGQLATAFDKMVKRLSETQTELAKASRAAGRSQVASTVIHNVGNVLTNVNSLLDAASGRVHGLRVGSLDKLALRLRHGDADDGLLAATPGYLEGLAGSLKSDQESIAELLATLHDNICHIHDVIRDQRRHTSHAVKASRVPLASVIDEAIACCRARLQQEDVSVEVSGHLSMEVRADRSLLLQTIINIIGNAQHAMRDNDSVPPVLSIHVEDAQNAARIRFRDNGCGMTEETIRKVFDAHFTTRESGTGLGLHFCAITLKRLGGSIQVSSDGLGCGSTFTIELPRAGQAADDTPSVYTLSASAP